MQIKQILEQSKIDRLDAELIIAHVLKKPREFVLAHSEQEIKKTKNQEIKRLLKQRAQNVPLAYLTGHKEFYGLDFAVNKYTLIPRPETELIVELALSHITYHISHNTTNKKIVLIDVGTGSGCIPISIANQIRKSGLSVIRKLYAIDISSQALLIAKQNAKHHKVKIKFLSGNLLSPITKTLKLYNFQLIITANLPYLTPSQFKNEKTIHHEPCLALVAGKDGLKYYKQLLKQIQSLLSTLKLYNFITFIEIDPSQSKTISVLIKKHLSQSKLTIHKDLAGKNRVVEIIVSTEL